MVWIWTVCSLLTVPKNYTITNIATITQSTCPNYAEVGLKPAVSQQIFDYDAESPRALGPLKWDMWTGKCFWFRCKP